MILSIPLQHVFKQIQTSTTSYLALVLIFYKNLCVNINFQNKTKTQNHKPTNAIIECTLHLFVMILPNLEQIYAFHPQL